MRVAFLFVTALLFYINTAKALAVKPSASTDTISKKHRFEFELKYDNDNYLYGLKDVLHTKDGNDYGYTFMLGADLSYSWKDESVKFSYNKILFSSPVLDGSGNWLYIKNTTNNKQLNVARQVDVDRLRLRYKKGDIYFWEAFGGIDNRSRSSSGSFSAASMQSAAHNSLAKIYRGFYYVAPNDPLTTTYPYTMRSFSSENLPDKISPISVIAGGDVGLNYSLKYQAKLNAKIGYSLSTENNRFIGQNSNGFFSAILNKKIGKKNILALTLQSSTMLYAKSNATTKQFGFLNAVGFSIPYFKVKPYFLLNFPSGRQEYAEFNDTDNFFRIGLIL